MGDKIQPKNNLIAYAVDQNILLLNSENICVASSSHKKISETVEFDRSKTLTKTTLKIDDNTSFSFYYEKNQYSQIELELFKKLARMTYEQHVSTVSKPPSNIDQFITQVLKRPFNLENESVLENEAQSLGLNLTLPRVAVLVEIKDFTQKELMPAADAVYTSEDIIKDWKNKIIFAISNFFTIKTDIIAYYNGNDQFVFFKEIVGDLDKFKKNMKSSYSTIFGPLIASEKDNLSVSYSNLHSGIKGLHDSYYEAIQALQVGRKFARNNNQSYYYGDLGSLRILTEENDEKKVSYAQEILQPLDKESLRLTLETFLNENMDIKKTAAKLKVHPNTVNYRLGKIAEELGLDPRVFKQAFELRIALLTDRIFT